LALSFCIYSVQKISKNSGTTIKYLIGSFIDSSGKNVLAVSSPISKTQENEFRLKTAMNMFLVLFNRFDTFGESLKKPVTIIKKVPWEILKSGTRLEDQTQIKVLLNKVNKSQRSMYKGDLDILLKYNPSLIATGKMGFHGYIVFYYAEKNIAIIESVIPGNATYVFDKNWEELSQLTKTEVLSEKLQKDRIIHNYNWKNKVEKLFI